MKPIASPLNIIDFAILQFEYEYVPSVEIGEDMRKNFNDYDLDVDFDIHNNDVLQVYIKTSVNRSEKKLPGYSIFAEIACLFNFNEGIDISTENKKNIEGFSSVYIALNSLRGFIAQLTSSGPVGRYILPSIDLNDLIDQKKAQVSGTENLKHEKNEKKKNEMEK